MIYEIFAQISSFIINTISTLGYPGIVILMTLESACIPIPSEIIMPFSGYLVYLGEFSLWLVVIVGTIGNLIGSIISYFIGFYGGRPLIEKYGKYILISGQDLDQAERWFKKYGGESIFFSRILPVIRTFISFPAGIAKMPFWKFSFYTFAGSLPWSFFLTYAGILTGENWSKLEIYFKKFDWLIIILIISGISWWIYKKIKTKNL
ncbi:MAG: alkaline phosphatase [Candidatus Nealsonbacteria bacterium CG_4_9_14_0_2_um_filter_37_38]|uniref:Alkaline phosphatase n=1 Tax=Candidatus Nealsonbacteria bacterium CG_4_10_14_0_8_um_filter_37_14 TaxID=1974684 RepID=A0A2M7R5X9_9BACT|nr:MAG: alkaline phosphatase [Candidatus Nealsonbacteria bacterium CG11_big_fil_rev_8_21_14_0_20_37_68]PIW91987.1 MAG: alkaline phosphatase [Candidatus Nealsonbacteria bacterium CG_4_8_14_3_um_filter_37_23]PIY88821.1 MAG: alkaline phosphatase [Candidatus Nealsonbacteria bacterium CG_4_10_14_0_8_um_filter_37_14]PJC51886.1 MAG: alkaline phosphatase [Candidatus Nealsonbacteria bacterium CG_4_9_14_0_2_um_filter_37_38]